MLKRWPIRNKLLVGVLLLVLILSALSWSSISSLYEYRGLVKSLDRVAELKHATELARAITDLRLAAYEVTSDRPRKFEGSFSPGVQTLAERDLRGRCQALRQALSTAREALARYQQQLDAPSDNRDRLDDRARERATILRIEAALGAMEAVNTDQAWAFESVAVGELRSQADRLQNLSAELPNHLHGSILAVSSEMKERFTVVLGLGWVSAGLTLLMLTGLAGLVCNHILRPLRILADGSLRIAGGDFRYRIRLGGRDEMGELAAAMNETTNRFVAIRDDLESQVQQRSAQIVRSERLASVGFLAAGISHEINNPLASIQLCADSLEGRLREQPLEAMTPANRQVVDKYLRMMHREAVRCRQITSRLLDFSRWGEAVRQPTELGKLVQEMIEMLAHLPSYRNHEIALVQAEEVVAYVNAQELKQVLVNLLTNALESLEDRDVAQGKGRVIIEVRQRGDEAEIVVTDNGCGMSAEVQSRLFEPFFTRRRSGNGTGLGLTIADRIVRAHGGTIHGRSDGPGKGSTFCVRIPLEAGAPAPNGPRSVAA